MQIQELMIDKHAKYFYAAYGAALLCPGIGGRKNNTFRLGSVIIYKKNILTIKFNSAKTHPKLLPFSTYPFLHSESNAILSLGLDNCEDTTLYVLRILRNLEIAMAKPCSACMKLIKYVGIRRIYYTTNIGYMEIIL